jgi:hypothetical protein
VSDIPLSFTEIVDLVRLRLGVLQCRISGEALGSQLVNGPLRTASGITAGGSWDSLRDCTRGDLGHRQSARSEETDVV